MIDETSLNLLKKTRLNDKQARVYLALLQLGKAGVSEIAITAQLKRPITYIVLEDLLANGYVNFHGEGAKKKVYTAADPTVIASEMEQTSHELKEMLPYLRALQRKAGKPYITYYTGVEGARLAFQQIRKPKEARYAISIEKAAKIIPEEVERWKKVYLAGRARPGGKHLLTNTATDRSFAQALAASDQVVHFISREKTLGMDLALVDGVVFLTTFDEVIHVSVIESDVLYRSLCILFDLAWEASAKQNK